MVLFTCGKNALGNSQSASCCGYGDSESRQRPSEINSDTTKDGNSCKNQASLAGTSTPIMPVRGRGELKRDEIRLPKTHHHTRNEAQRTVAENGLSIRSRAAYMVCNIRKLSKLWDIYPRIEQIFFH